MERYFFQSPVELKPERIKELERVMGGKVSFDCHLEEIEFDKDKNLVRIDAYHYSIQKRNVFSDRDQKLFDKRSLELVNYENQQQVLT